MNISKIKISNILGIESLEFNLGKFTTIEGENGKGKTSIIEAVKSVVKGGTNAKLLKNGSEKAEIVLLLDDGTLLNKKITSDKSEIIVTNKNGNKLSKPQSVIDNMFDMFSVNPIDFITADEKYRLKIMLEAIPMTVTQEQIDNCLEGIEKVKDDLKGHALDVINRIYKQLFDKRTGTNRSSKEQISTINQLQSSLENQESDILKNVLNIEEIPNKINELVEKKVKWESKKQELLQGILKKKDFLLEEARKEYEEKRTSINTSLDNEKSAIETDFNDKYVPLVEQLTRLQENSNHIGAIQNQKGIIKELKSKSEILVKESESITEALTNLNNLKSDLMKKLPIQGLEVKDGEIYFNGIDYETLNTAKQIEIAIEIAKLRVKDCGIICVDGIERLDSKNYEIFKEKAIESGLQMIVTKVTNDELTINTEGK